MGSLIAEGQRIAREAGGIEVVLEAMRKFIDVIEACTTGCSSLYCMIQNSCKWFDTPSFFKQYNLDEGQARAREAGGIEIVLEVMKRHATNALICKFGCCDVLFMVMNNGKKQTIHCPPHNFLFDS